LPAASDGEFDLWILEGRARVRYVVRDGLITRARYWSADGGEVRAWGEGEATLPGEVAGGEPARPAPRRRRRTGDGLGWRGVRDHTARASGLAPRIVAAVWRRALRWRGRPVLYALLAVAAALAGAALGAMTR